MIRRRREWNRSEREGVVRTVIWPITFDDFLPRSLGIPHPIMENYDTGSEIERRNVEWTCEENGEIIEKWKKLKLCCYCLI